MKKVMITLGFLISSLAIATSEINENESTPPETTPPQETCFQLSIDGLAWGSGPDLCLQAKDANGKSFLIFLKNPQNKQIFATFEYDLREVPNAKENKNRNRFGFLGQEESIFKDMMIRFKGNRNPATKEEAGEVRIGSEKYFYKKI